MSLHFLMSTERSGSNFITKLLNGHSNICGPSTKHLFNPVLRNLFRYEPITKKENWHVLLDDIFELYNVDFSVWKSNISRDELTNLASQGDINSLLRNIFYKEARQFDKQHLFIKENHLYEFLPYLLIHFPESKYIYLVRDPRDMALSWKKNPSHPGGVIQGARQWQKDQQSTLKNFNELRKLARAYLVTYEDLITESEKFTKEIVNFLGLEYEPQMMEFYKDILTQKNAETQDAWGNLSQSIISNNKNKYKDELTDEEVMYIEKICFYEMNYLGYASENNKSGLDKISVDELDEYNQKELDEIVLNRADGVKENMQAKKTFYQKLL